jgi:cyclopropane fatty-acyl-phospholipid synthase-like methyltransferase
MVRVGGSDVGLAFPPTDFMRLVCGDVPDLREHFEHAGRRIAMWLGRHEMLRPGTRLLDIGCGCGRVARHLLDSPIAAYDGFDRHVRMIRWAQSHITARDSRFRFQYVDVRSGYDELDSDVGAVPAAEFAFPYEDGTFAGALAASVFTHVDFVSTSHYLSETVRVLMPGGRVLASFFLGEKTSSMADSRWNFVIAGDDLQRAIRQARLNVLSFAPAPATTGQSWYLLEKPGT